MSVGERIPQSVSPQLTSARQNGERPENFRVLENSFFDLSLWGRGLVDLRREIANYIREYDRLLGSPVWRGESVPKGNGRPLILIQGVGVPAFLMGSMLSWSEKVGYDSHFLPSTIITNSWSPEIEALDTITTAKDLQEKSKQKVDVIGHSWGGYGGIYATMRLYSDQCSQYINHMVALGAPVNAPIRLNPWIGAMYHVATRAGRLLRGGMNESEFLEQFGNDLTIEAPNGVKLLIIESVKDGVVEGLGDGNGSFRNSDVTKCSTEEHTHLALTVHCDVYERIANFLAS